MTSFKQIKTIILVYQNSRTVFYYREVAKVINKLFTAVTSCCIRAY